MEAAASSAKRAKLNGTEPSASSSSSSSASSSSSSSHAAPRLPVGRHLFAPYLALGIISNHVPFVLQVRHGGKDADKPDVNIVTSLGDCWSIWTAENLMQVFVGSRTPLPISQLALSTSPDSILASAGPTIYRFTRGKVVAKYTLPLTVPAAAISKFIVFGDSIVALAQAESGRGYALYHFSLATTQLSVAIDLPGHAVPTAIVHPATYLHKVLVGFSDGALALWNVRDGSLVHQFPAEHLREKHKVPATAAGTTSPSVLALAQTPALDVVAITMSDNRVLLHDVKFDAAIMTFGLDAQLSSTPPTFRTDGRAHTMAVGSRSGDVFIFDLDPQEGRATNDDTAAAAANSPRLLHTIRNAHSGPIAGLEFVAGQPLLVSSAGDNAVKQWYFEPSSSSSNFDAASGAGKSAGSSSLPRLLKSREGHSEPPSLVRWYGQDGRAPLLSAGRDRSVRLGWVGREARGGELSQGSIVRKANQLFLPPASLKLEPATSLSFSLTRSRDWDDILTIHPSSPARKWFGRDRRMNATPLMQASSKKKGTEAATTGFVTHCGNFALVGTSIGTVGMWNMQSGRWVRGFDTRPLVLVDETGSAKKAKKQKKVRGKGSKVVGLVADEGNKELAVATASGGVYFFDFYTTALLSSQHFHPLVGLRPSPHATLLALIPLGLANPLFCIDFVTRRVVRKFGPMPARITDATFNPTLRSLLVSTMDGCLSTFDVPSGLLIDRIRLREVMVSVDWSPDGTMIAACGTEGKGIYLWSWTSGRGRIVEDDDDDDNDAVAHGAVQEVGLPSVRGPDAEDEVEVDETDEGTASGADTGTPFTPSLDPLLSKPAGEEGSHPLITLSAQPRTKWTTLLSLDAIKARDRPKEPPKKPKSAPFFLGMSMAPPSSAIGGSTAGQDAQNFFAGGGAAQKGAGDDEDKPRETFLEQMTRRSLALREESHVEKLLRDVVPATAGAHTATECSDPEGTRLFLYLLSLSPPQLDLLLRLELSSLLSMALFLQACAARLHSGRDYEAVLSLVEVLRRVRGSEMLGLDEVHPQSELDGQGGDADVDVDVHMEGMEEADDDADADGRLALKSAWSEYLVAQQAASRRVGDLLDYTIGTLAFLRGVPVV